MRILSSSGSRLLTLLLSLISALSLSCLLAPGASALPPVPAKRHSSSLNPLAKRVDPRGPKYLKVLESATRVTQDDQDFQSFQGRGPFVFASDGFIGCFGIVIASQNGAIIGHYTCGDNGLSLAEKEIPKLVNEHEKELEGGRAWVYAQSEWPQTNVLKQPQKTDEFVNVVRGAYGEPELKTYIEPEDTWVDENGDIIQERVDKTLYGAMIIENEGDGGSTEVTFIGTDVQV